MTPLPDRWISPKASKLMFCPRCQGELQQVKATEKYRAHLKCGDCFGVYTLVKISSRFPAKMHVQSRELHVSLHLEQGRESADRKHENHKARKRHPRRTQESSVLKAGAEAAKLKAVEAIP